MHFIKLEFWNQQASAGKSVTCWVNYKARENDAANNTIGIAGLYTTSLAKKTASLLWLVTACWTSFCTPNVEQNTHKTTSMEIRSKDKALVKQIKTIIIRQKTLTWEPHPYQEQQIRQNLHNIL